jgi:MFS family permease
MGRNVKLIYVLSLIGDVFFPISVWMFYFLEYISFPQLAAVTAVGAICAVFLEIPTGAFADTYGRKLAIALSYIFFTIAMAMIAFTPSFPVLIAAAVLNSLANALYSGSLDAMVYDSLQETDALDSYPTVTSRLEAISWIGLLFGSVSGGYLYSVAPNLPYIAQGVLTVLGIGAAFALHEPRHAREAESDTDRDFLRQNAVGFTELFRNGHVAVMAVMFIVIEAGYITAASILGISQAREYGVSPQMVGIIFGVGYLISAIFSYHFPRLQKVAGNKLLLVASTAVLIISFLFASFAPVTVGIALIIARIGSSTTFRNVRSIVMNRYISSRNRATALSTLVLLSQLPYMILAYPIGVLIERTSPNVFAMYLGFGMMIVLAPILLAYINVKRV